MDSTTKYSFLQWHPASFLAKKASHDKPLITSHHDWPQQERLLQPNHLRPVLLCKNSICGGHVSAMLAQNVLGCTQLPIRSQPQSSIIWRSDRRSLQQDVWHDSANDDQEDPGYLRNAHRKENPTNDKKKEEIRMAKAGKSKKAKMAMAIWCKIPHNQTN